MPVLPALDHTAGVPGGGALPLLLLTLALATVGAKVVGELCERIGQAAVVGELLLGVAMGNLALLGGPDLSRLTSDETLTALAEIGAVLMLFEVGLQSTVAEMLSLGARAALVACVGIVTSTALGFGVATLLRPDMTRASQMFLGALLAATSVGVAARVFRDAGAVRQPAARIVLGAAVIDDVLSLVLVAGAAATVRAASAGEALSGSLTLGIVSKAVAFLLGALLIGSFVSPRLFRRALALRSRGVVLSLSLGFCFALSYVATRAGLAPIVGAFGAGLVLEEVHFEDHVRRGEPPLHASLEPLAALLVPLFFIRMGMLVDLRALGSWSTLGLAFGLTVAAVLGKLVCGIAAPKGASGLTVGIGMIPRGEVVLIFAGMGRELTYGGRSLVDSGAYTAALLVVIATTLLAPPLLMQSLRGIEAQATEPRAGPG